MKTGFFTQMAKATSLLILIIGQFLFSFSAEASHTRGSTVYWEKHPTINDAIIVYATASTAGTTTVGNYTGLGTLTFGTAVTLEYYSGSGVNNTVTSSSSVHNPNGLLFYSTSIENYYSRKLVRKDAAGNIVDGAIVRFPANTTWPVNLTFSVACCRVGTMNESQGTESNGGTLIDLTTPNSSPVSSSPAVIQVPSSFIGSQTPFTYQIVASDPENDGIRFNRGSTSQFGGTWLASGTFPTGLTISNSGLLTWQIPTTVNNNTVNPSGGVQNYLANLAFTIEDYDPLDPNTATKSRASYDIILRISNTATNQPPQIVSLPQTTQFAPYVLGAGNTYNFTIVAQDIYNASTNTLPMQGGYVTVTQVSQIPNFTYTTSIVNDQTVLNCSFTPSASQAGNSYTAIFQFDDGSLITWANVSIQVANNPKPTINDIQFNGDICSGINFNSSTFTSNYSDPDSDPLEWIRLTNLPNSGLLLYKGNAVTSGDEILFADLANLSYTNSNPGTYTLSWEAKDDQGNWSTTAETLTMLVEGIKTSGTSNTNSSTTSPVAIDSQISVVYVGSKSGATVSISNGYVNSDILQVAIPNNISATSSYSNGVLSVSGTLTSAELQAIFRLVEFQSATTSSTRSFTFSVGTSIQGCDPFTATRSLNNTLPTISGASDQTTCLTGTTPTLNITVGDAETNASALILSVLSSSNSSVVPVQNVVFGGTGTSRTLSVTNSGVYGSSIITIAVTDAGGGVATQSFVWSNTSSDGVQVSAGTTFNPYASTPLQVDKNLTVISQTNISGALVSVDNFKTGDVLGIKSGYTLPGGLTSSYNSSTGVLTISGTTTAANMQAALRNVVFSTTSSVETARNISFTLGAALPNPANSHYYEYVASANITWSQAKQAAALRSFNGLGGYLATVTTSTENQFIYTKLSNDGWLGGSDDYSVINAEVSGANFANQAAAEGKWYWVTGPASDRVQFWNSGSVNGVYSNWNPNEPNNSQSNEHCLQIYFLQSGRWNDLSSSTTLQGYIVEYGGLATDVISCFNSTAIKTFELNQTPTITGNATASICIGNALTLTENLTVGDANDGTGSLGLTLISSSNTTLVPLANVSFGGTGSARTITITVPNNAASGTSNLVIEVSDRYGKSAQHTLAFTYAACAPTVTTGSVSNTASTTSSIGGNVTNQGGSTVTDRGIVYGTSTAPTISGTKAQSGTGTGTYTANLTGLLPNTLYYARAYATNTQGTAYGSEVTFTTAPAVPAAITTNRDDATFGGPILCLGQSVTLTSSVATGTLEWFSASCGGTSITPNAGGASITVSPTTTTTYYVRTYNATTGLRSACQSVTVTVQAAAPTITYANPYYLYYSSEAITANSVTVSGSGAQAYIASYSISPALPAGLSFNTATGQITGTSTNGSPRTTYTISGTTPCGTVTTTLEIEVLECSGLNVNDFLLRGNASTIGSGASTEFQLTPATNAQFGAVWNKTRLNLSNDFDISSQVYLGNSDGGADGIAFVLQPLSTNQGSSGGGLGYAGISPSLSVEFDTYTNSEPTSADHIAMMVNGNTADHTFAGHHAVEMEDGQWRSARFKWVAATKTFTVYLNGTQILQKANYDIVANIFNNNTNVYWGFTGATGGAVNVQKVKFDRYCLTLAANTVANVTTTTPIGTVTSTSAAIAGEVVNDGGASVTERGFVIGLATAPTTSGTKITDGTGVGPITGTFTGLLPATRYYARAYAVNSQGTSYGNEISFYTRPADITGVTSNNFNTTHQANVICYGGSTTLTAAGVSGTVYWYTGSCGGTQVGTGNTLTVSPTTTTTYYARNYNNNLFSDGCASITVVVRPQLVAPVISGAEIICWNSQATGLTGTQAQGGSSAANNAGFSYQWQKSEDNGQTWQNLTGQTNYASLMPGYLYQTTKYRLLATDLGSPSCTTNVASNVIEVTVRDPFTPSVVSTTNANNTVCHSGSVSLAATATTGGSGPPFQYQWQESADGVNWTDVGPALQNNPAYTVPSVTADTYYRLIAFDQGTPGCGSVFSTNSVLVTVQTAITQGAISGAQHICAQTAPTAPITSTTVGTGRGTITYRWEASTNNGQTWTTISGATAASYQPGVLQTTTDFRRITVSTVNNVACESTSPTNVVRITVDQLPVATIATTGTTSCVNAPVTVPGVTINYGTAVWTHNGQGSISGTLGAPVYTPVAADAGTNVTLTLTVTGTAICLSTTAVDTYVITVDRLPVATAGGSATICQNATHTVSGAVAQNGTILWTHNGAGTISGATTVTPTYTAAAGDAGNTVTLTMTVSSNNTCSPATATATYAVTVNQLPAATAGGTQTICSLGSATVSGATAARGTILWTHNGTGTITGATTTTPTYTAGAGDAGTTVTLTMTVTSTNACAPQTATATYTVVVRPTFVPATFVAQDQDLCYNTSATQITATAATGGTGPYAYQWQVSTNGTSWTNINGATGLTFTPTGTFTSTRYYRILSTDLGTPNCGTTLPGASNMTLLVRAPLTPPVLQAVTICNGGTATLNPSPATGGRGNFTYQWQQSANGSTGWSNVGTSSTSIAFTTPTLTGSTYYRVIARDEDVVSNGTTYISCGSTFSQPINVIVGQAPTAGSISGDQTTCVGTATTAIASGAAGSGSGTISYRWEQSVNNGTTWTTISGATSATYAPGNLSQTTLFRRYTVSTLNGTVCESAPTANVTKTVQQLAVFTAAGSNVNTNTDAGLPTAVVNYTVTATAVTPVTLTYALTGATTATGSGTGSGTAFGIGTTNVTVTATTSCGATTTSFTVLVVDNENPVITAGADQTFATTTATTGCARPVTLVSPVATDNAPGVQVSYVLTGATTGTGTAISNVSFNVGSTTVTWTATDGSANTATDVQVVTVTDGVLPAIAGTPSNITLNATSGLCTAPATWTAPTASDECGVQTFTGSHTSGALFAVGVTTVTYTATDIHGNVATSTFTVTVADSQKPVITGVPSNITVTSDANACGKVVAWTAPTAADNCAMTSFNPNVASGSFFAVGRTRVRYTAVDVNGNTDTAGFWVTVQDRAPVLSNMPANITGANDAGLCTRVVTWTAPTFTDNCTGTVLTSTHTPGSAFPVGTTTVTYTATDNNGNATSASFTVTVTDTELPTWTNVPANITVASSATSCNAVVTWTAPTAADNCTAQPTVTVSKASGSTFALGTTTVTYTATDAAGNARQASFTVTVVDQTAPVIAAPVNITKSVDANSCASSTVVITAPVVTDQCNQLVASGVRSDNLALTAAYPLGVTTITWTSSDLAGNAAVAKTQSVTIVDTIAPKVTTQLDSLVYVDENSCVFYWEDWRSDLVITDNCGDTAVLTSARPQNLFLNKGVHIINYTITDSHGNSNVYNQRVRVVDTISPKLTNMPANITAYAGANCQTIVTWVDPTPSDNCVNFVMTSSHNAGDVFPIGVTPVNFLVTDASGRTVSGGFTVTILDTAKPAIPVQAATIALNASGQATLTLAQVLTSAGITDNCGVASSSLSKSAFTCADLGANTVTVTATDVNGNTRTRTVTVTVVDNTAPAVVTKAATLYLNASGTATLAAAAVNNSTTDNCGGLTYSLSKSTFNCSNIGANTVTLTATDASGNAGSATAVVTVLDTVKPVLTVASDTIVSYVSGNQCSKVVNVTGVSATDNCAASLTYSPANGSVFTVGTTPVLVTASDASGNSRAKTMYVVVRDTIKPVIAGVPVTATITPVAGACSANVSWASPAAFDNCTAVLTSSAQSGSVFAVGTHTVTWTATDASGNVRTASLTFTVADVQAPQFTAVPSTITRYATASQCTATVSWPAITATDNCSTAPTITTSIASGSVFGLGTTAVTATAMDAAGNTTTASFNVVVLDTIKPVWTSVPQNVVSGSCAATVSFVAPTATDNCSGVTVVQTAGLPTGSVFPIGVTTNTFVATDASGNSRTTSFTVTVQGSTFTYTPAQSTYCAVDMVVDLMPVGATNLSFSGPGVSGVSSFNPINAGVGNHVITYTYVDALGCQTVGTFVLTVYATPTKPVIQRMTSTTLKVVDTYASYQWRRNGINIAGATQQTYTVTSSGVYSVVVGNGNCTSVSDPYGFGVTIGEEELELNDLRVQPNPNNGHFTLIHSLPLEQVQSVQIVDMLGRVVYSAPLNDARMIFDLSGVAQGQYLVVVRSTTNVVTKPIVIQY